MERRAFFSLIYFSVDHESAYHNLMRYYDSLLYCVSEFVTKAFPFDWLESAAVISFHLFWEIIADGIVWLEKWFADMDQ